MAGKGVRANLQQGKPLKKKSLSKDAEYQINLRGGLSEKQKLIILLSETYNKSTSAKNFYHSLEKKGFSIYQRGGKNYGIQGKVRNYRFKTLGYSIERIQFLDNPKLQRLKELEILKEKKKKNISKER